MLRFPNCKINLGLQILRKRADGYHDLATVFYPIGLKDALEIIPRSEFTNPQHQSVEWTQSGLTIEGNPQQNLCIKAYHSLKQMFPTMPSVAMHLHKTIPMGAGLGGGSADGAFTIMMLNDLFKLNLNPEQQIDLALSLGSDCPFFVLNKPCYATSRGEVMQEISLKHLSNYYCIIVNPGIHISTAWAFSQIKPRLPEIALEIAIHEPINTWNQLIINDFELPVCNAYPEVKQVIEQMYTHGAVYCSMTGSGSTLFGFFEKGITPSLQFPSHYFVFDESKHPS